MVDRWRLLEIFLEREREKESFIMSVFKRLLYHNSFPSHPNSGLLDLKQTKAKQACALSSDLTSMLYICTFAPFFKIKKKKIYPAYRL